MQQVKDTVKETVNGVRGLDIKKIAMIGCGSMGGGMAQLFAEKGIFVALQDPSDQQMQVVLDSARQSGIGADKIKKYGDYESLCQALDTPRVFVWSLPHGGVGDKVLEGLMPYLEKGDVIVDCGNEHWENTERRQGKCTTKGIRYVGCGVSGGYQAAYAVRLSTCLNVSADLCAPDDAVPQCAPAPKTKSFPLSSLRFAKSPPKTHKETLASVA